VSVFDQQNDPKNTFILKFKFLNLLLAANNYQPPVGGMAQTVPKGPEDDASGYASLLSAAQKSNETYEQVNNRAGIVPLERDSREVSLVNSLFLILWN